MKTLGLDLGGTKILAAVVADGKILARQHLPTPRSGYAAVVDALALAATGLLRDHPDSTGAVGCVGFCYGGGVCNALAVAYPDLRASVPFYGRQPKAEDVPAIRAPLTLHYAGMDTRINEGWPAYEAALKANGKDYQAFFYEGVNHGFHNDTTPRYDPEAAALAWERTMAFFAEKLR